MYKGEMQKMDKVTITKKISKHGSQPVIILPNMLEDMFRPKDIVEVKLKMINIGDSQ